MIRFLEITGVTRYIIDKLDENRILVLVINVLDKNLIRMKINSNNLRLHDYR